MGAVWFDPPWEFHSVEGLLTTSADYDEETFGEWSGFFNPLNSSALESWGVNSDNSVEFLFDDGYRLFLPFDGDERDEDDWYSQWYAQDRDT